MMANKRAQTHARGLLLPTSGHLLSCMNVSSTDGVFSFSFLLIRTLFFYYFTFIFILFIYLFIFGCVGSSFLYEGFL